MTGFASLPANTAYTVGAGSFTLGPAAGYTGGRLLFYSKDT